MGNAQGPPRPDLRVVFGAEIDVEASEKKTDKTKGSNPIPNRLNRAKGSKKNVGLTGKDKHGEHMVGTKVSPITALNNK